MEHPVDPDLPEYEPGEPRYGSLDEVFFGIHAEHGPEVLREALGMLEIGREDLEGAAAALEAAGKPSIASIVREVAAEAPSGIDLYDPYEEGSINSRAWRRSWSVKRRVASGEMAKDLRRRQALREASQARKH